MHPSWCKFFLWISMQLLFHFHLSAAQTDSHTTSVIISVTRSSSSQIPSQTFVGYAPYGASFCALTCSYGTSLCSLSDPSCLCSNPRYENSVQDCMLINCGGESRAANRIHATFCQPVLSSLSASASESSTSSSAPSLGLRSDALFSFLILVPFTLGTMLNMNMVY